jgi:hypothetical protein
MIVMQLLRQVRKRTRVPNFLAKLLRVDGCLGFLRRNLQTHRAAGYFLRVAVFTTTALAMLEPDHAGLPARRSIVHAA